MAGNSLRRGMLMCGRVCSLLYTVIDLVGAQSWPGYAAFGRRFRVYSALSILTMLIFGFMTALDVPRVDAPWLGVNERIMMASWLFWMAVLSVGLLGERRLAAAPQ